ncbi:MAG TPA: DUF4900 domain-containing protein [Patescibacteria group bacterium]|nr:DUF4900 domain-containing protein [Patescibacteria group bacterium]
MQKNKGSILAITVGFALIFTMLGMASIYMAGLQSESQEKQILGQQAFWLAEAGATHALAALRNQIRLDLRTAIQNDSPSSVSHYSRGYFLNQNALGLLSQYAHFTVNDNTATLQVSPAQPVDVGSGVQGTYQSIITVQPRAVTHPNNPLTDTYVFNFTYSIASAGSIVNSAVRKAVNLSNGNFTITVQRDNFARFALFTNHHVNSSGEIVWFTANTNFGGPVHTNERLSFANNPSGHFTEEVTQAETTARFYNNASPLLIDADHNGTRDVPIFDQGFLRGQADITLPSTETKDSLKAEALGGIPEPTVDGVYVPMIDNQVTGGIYIRGDASLALSIDANDRPVYAITQGAHTTNVTVDYSAKTTTVGASTYSGIPDGMTQSGGALIYAKNKITGFSGTVQRDSLVTVSGESDIAITGNIQYEKDPRISGNENYNNLLGIISWGTKVHIGTGAPDNINIDAIVLVPNGVFTTDNYDDSSRGPRGIATLLGGTIEDHYGAFGTFSVSRQGVPTQRSGYGRNFIYDERMLQGMIPLYFPFLPNFIADENGLNDHLSWQEG